MTEPPNMRDRLEAEIVDSVCVDAALTVFAEAVEPYLLALRGAVSRAEFADDHADLAALFDLLDNLGGAA